MASGRAGVDIAATAAAFPLDEKDPLSAVYNARPNMICRTRLPRAVGVLRILPRARASHQYLFVVHCRDLGF